MNRIQPITYGLWSVHPTYKCDIDVWVEVAGWMWGNEVEFNQLSSSSNGDVIFQVESKHDWFVMRWT